MAEEEIRLLGLDTVLLSDHPFLFPSAEDKEDELRVDAKHSALASSSENEQNAESSVVYQGGSFVPSKLVDVGNNETDISGFQILDKKEAKKNLSKEEYKKWKKYMKKLNKKGEREEDERRSSDEGEEGLEEKAAESHHHPSSNSREADNNKKHHHRKRRRSEEDDEHVEGEKKHRRHHRHHHHHKSGGNDDDEDDSALLEWKASESEENRGKRKKRKTERTEEKKHRKQSKRSREGDADENKQTKSNKEETLADIFGVSDLEEDDDGIFDHDVVEGIHDKASRSANSKGVADPLLSSASQSRNARGVNPNKPKKYLRPTAESLRPLAEALLEKMENAQKEDDNCIANPTLYGPPLHRILISKEVELMFAKKVFQPHLLENGRGLNLLSRWLLETNSTKKGERRAEERTEASRLGSLELRSKALDILLCIPIYQPSEEGEAIEGRKGGRGNRGGWEGEGQGVTGYSRENLIGTDLGRAVNIVRQHANETPENRAKCAALLERFSRAFTAHLRQPAFSSNRDGRDSHESALSTESAATTVSWKCKNQSDVASPFQIVPTVCEQFQKEFMRPDPRDPTSYFNLLPPRFPVKVVTNLSGKLAKEFAHQFGED